MRDLTRQSIYRIIYDIIKADNMISGTEIEFMKSLCNNYDITQENRVAAMNLTLSEAVNEVHTMPVRQKAKFLKEIDHLTRIDGVCSQSEALLLFCIKRCLETDNDSGCRLVSVACSDIMMEKNQMVYIEDIYDDDQNANIRQNLQSIMNTCSVSGFDFVYIPSLCEKFNDANHSLVLDIVSYLSPSDDETVANRIVEELKNITTVKFYRELLIGKLHFTLDLCAPSLLFRLGYSIVNGKKMANYACMEIKGNVLRQTEELTNAILQLQRVQTITVSRQMLLSDTLQYSGFYRTLLDLITYKKGKTCELHIHPYSHKNVLTILTSSADKTEEHPLLLGPKESAFYVFLIQETIEYGGLNIAGQTAQDIKDLYSAQERFKNVYLSLCNRDTAPDITNAEIRRPMMSKIKKAIETHPSIIGLTMFLPDINKLKVIKVHLEKEHVKIVKTKD